MCTRKLRVCKLTTGTILSACRGCGWKAFGAYHLFPLLTTIKVPCLAISGNMCTFALPSLISLLESAQLLHGYLGRCVGCLAILKCQGLSNFCLYGSTMPGHFHSHTNQDGCLFCFSLQGQHSSDLNLLLCYLGHYDNVDYFV